MTIRIEPLDDGFLVTDARGPRVWRGAAVSLADAEIMARHRVHPWTAAPPPGVVLGSPPSTYNGATEHTGYAEVNPPVEPSVVHPLAERQFEQAAGELGPCVGSLCGSD